MKVARRSQPDFTWTRPRHLRLSVLSSGTQTRVRHAAAISRPGPPSLSLPPPSHPCLPPSLGEERWPRAAPCYLRAQVVSQAEITLSTPGGARPAPAVPTSTKARLPPWRTRPGMPLRWLEGLLAQRLQLEVPGMTSRYKSQDWFRGQLLLSPDFPPAPPDRHHSSLSRRGEPPSYQHTWYAPACPHIPR